MLFVNILMHWLSGAGSPRLLGTNVKSCELVFKQWGA